LQAKEDQLSTIQSLTPTAERKAYQDFLTLWKDADPDIPILKEAKAGYAKLQ
jgi:eukaryotic-like serine/threonine-protein kinase